MLVIKSKMLRTGLMIDETDERPPQQLPIAGQSIWLERKLKVDGSR